jgi:hypothetical protein
MSIRSTNVYEERSLGVFEHNEASEDEPTLHGDKSEVFRSVLSLHFLSTQSLTTQQIPSMAHAPPISI